MRNFLYVIIFILSCALIIALANSTPQLTNDLSKLLRGISFSKFTDGYAVAGVKTENFGTPVCIGLIIEKKADEYFWVTNNNLQLSRLDHTKEHAFLDSHDSIFTSIDGAGFINIHHFYRNSPPLSDCTRFPNIYEVRTKYRPGDFKNEDSLSYKIYTTYPMDDYPQPLKFEGYKLVIDKKLPNLPLCDQMISVPKISKESSITP